MSNNKVNLKNKAVELMIKDYGFNSENAHLAYRAVLKALGKTLLVDKIPVEIRGFGVFYVSKSKEYKIKTILTNNKERIVPPRIHLRFRPSLILKQILNGEREYGYTDSEISNKEKWFTGDGAITDGGPGTWKW